MYLSDVVRRSGRSLRSAKARTLLTAMAIAVGAFALTLTLAASNGAQHFVNKIIGDNFNPAELIVTKDPNVFGRADFSKPQVYDNNFSSVVSNAGAVVQIKRLSDDDITKLKSLPNVQAVRVGQVVNLQYITRPGQKKYVGTVQAINPAQHPELLAGKISEPLSSGNIVIPEGFLEALGFNDATQAIGKNVTVVVKKSFDQSSLASLVKSGSIAIDQSQIDQLSNSGQLKQELTITAVMKKPSTSQPGTELYMFISARDAKKFSDFNSEGTADYHKYTFVYAEIKDGKDKTKLKSAQDSLKTAGFTSQSVADTEKFLTQIITILQGIVATFGAIAVIASIFGIVNTMYISVLQRTREIGLMKALGMHRKDIGRLFRFEAAWIGFLGGVIGSLLAFTIGTLLNPIITKKLDLGQGNSLLIFKPLQVIILIVVLMIVATMAGLLPARKASKLDPIEALRTE